MPNLPPGHVRAGDLGPEHRGRLIAYEGVTGTLHAYNHIDDAFTQILVNDPDDGVRIFEVGAGAPIRIAPQE